MNGKQEPDPIQILSDLGAVWSPDFDAYASGELPIHRVRCVLCTKAPCECQFCGAPYRSYLTPENAPAVPCGMRIQPDGECPRGHLAARPGRPADGRRVFATQGQLAAAPDWVARPPDVPGADPARFIARAVSATGQTADFHLSHPVIVGEALHLDGTAEDFTVVDVRPAPASALAVAPGLAAEDQAPAVADVLAARLVKRPGEVTDSGNSGAGR